MTLEMRNLRKEDISLYYYLKHVVLIDFIEREEVIPLRRMTEIPDCYVYEALTDMLPNPTERGRGWVYFDNPYDIIEQYSRVILHDSTKIVIDELENIVLDEEGNIVIIGEYMINETEWMVDYIDGRIITSGTCNPTHVTYDWHTISLVDEWSVVEASDTPVVVIDIHGTNKTGYQLGAGRKAVRKVDLHVFASSAAERNDVVEILYDGLYLKSCPLYDFPNGTILDYDGTFYGRRDNMNKSETPFDRTTVSGVSRLQFENITNRNIKLPPLLNRNKNEIMLSDLNAYRSKISFEMVSYVNV